MAHGVIHGSKKPLMNQKSQSPEFLSPSYGPQKNISTNNISSIEEKHTDPHDFNTTILIPQHILYTYTLSKAIMYGLSYNFDHLGLISTKLCTYIFTHQFHKHQHSITHGKVFNRHKPQTKSLHTGPKFPILDLINNSIMGNLISTNLFKFKHRFCM